MRAKSSSTAIGAILLASVAHAEISKIVRVDQPSQQYIDSEGRSRHFHGTNMVVKGFPYHANLDNFVPGYSIVDKDIQHLKDMNINVVRLGVHWAGVEPVRGEYNQTYLDVTMKAIKRLEENGVYTLVDHHQDVWAPQICGHGAPIWFMKKDWVPEGRRFPVPQKLKPFPVDANGVPSQNDCGSIDWALSYLNYAVGNAFGRLYNNYDGLGDAWAAYWKVLAKNYGKVAGVMGYDLMNEPWVGDHMADPTLLIPGVADHKTMEPLWNKGNAAIRQVDNITIVMFEGSTYDILAGFNNVPGGDGSKTAHSYHYYKPPQLISIETTIKNRVKDATRLRTTGMLTEFEIWGRSPEKLVETVETVRVADKYLQSWAAWSYEEAFNREKPGSDPYPELAHIYARTYAEATAGITKSSYFEDVTGKYWVSWTANKAISAPGLIRVVPKEYYPDGFRVISNPPNAVTHSMESENVIRLHYTKDAQHGQTITTSIQPKFPTGAITNSKSGGKCIDVSEGKLTPNSQIILFKCGTSWNQVWKFKEGAIKIAIDNNRQFDKYCLDAQYANAKYHNVVLNPCESGKASQQWKATPSGNIVNTATGYCLDIEAEKYKDGTRIIAWSCGNKQANQLWNVPEGVNGVWQVSEQQN